MHRQKIRKTLEERFWEKVEKSEGCWLWTANTTKDKKGNKRYGLIGAGRRGEGMLYAHRVSWEMHNGPIPDSLMVLHTCDVPFCVSPLHLFLGNQTDNMHDMVLKGRQGKTGPKAGSGARSKLDGVALNALRNDSIVMTQRELASKYRICRATVYNILAGITNQNR